MINSVDAYCTFGKLMSRVGLLRLYLTNFDCSDSSMLRGQRTSFLPVSNYFYGIDFIFGFCYFGDASV